MKKTKDVFWINFLRVQASPLRSPLPGCWSPCKASPGKKTHVWKALFLSKKSSFLSDVKLFFCWKYLCSLLRGWEVDGKLDYAKKSEKRATGTKNNPNLKTQIILRKETKKLHVFGNFLRIYCNSFKKSLLNSCEIYFLQQVKEQCQSWRRKHKYF